MAQTMIDRIGAMQDFKLYRELHWEGTFEEYLALVRERPQVTRNAYQRLYDMIISFGTEEYIDNKKRLVRYSFFQDARDGAHVVRGEIQTRHLGMAVEAWDDDGKVYWEGFVCVLGRLAVTVLDCNAVARWVVRPHSCCRVAQVGGYLLRLCCTPSVGG